MQPLDYSGVFSGGKFEVVATRRRMRGWEKMALRILQVIGQMGFGGAELMTAQVAPRLAARRLDVEVLVIGNYQAEVLSQLRDSGTLVHAENASLHSIANITRLASLVTDRSIDVVHAHLFPSLYWAALAKSLCLPSVRWVYTEHSTDNGRRNHSWLRPLERWMYARFDVITCVSAEVRTALLQWVPDANAAVIQNGIDIERFSCAEPLDRATLGIGAESVVIATVGAFRPEKNHLLLMNAFALLPDSYTLVLAGEGDERSKVERLAKQLGVNDRVRFLGAFSGVDGLYKMADVYVLASTAEGFGLSALEAAAAGIPIAYSNVPGLREMLDGAGWPFDPESVESIANGISIAAKNGRSSPQVRHGQIVAARYSLSVTVDKLYSLYRSLSR